MSSVFWNRSLKAERWRFSWPTCLKWVMLCIHNQLGVRCSSSKQEVQWTMLYSGSEHTAAKVREMVRGAQFPSLPSHVQKVPFFLALAGMVIKPAPVSMLLSPCNVYSCFVPSLNQILTSLLQYVRNSGPHHLLYLHYESSFATQAVEMKLLVVVDVLCQCDKFQFPGKRRYTSKTTTSVGTATSWFYHCKSAKPGCFHQQKFLAGSWRNRGILNWCGAFGAGTAAVGETGHFFLLSFLPPFLPPPGEVGWTDPFNCT